jgi:hypothetical protein
LGFTGDFGNGRMRSSAGIRAVRRVIAGAIVLLLVLLTSVTPDAQTGSGGQFAPVPCESQTVVVTVFAAPVDDAALLCDSDGLIVHRATAEHPYGDGGDTAQREGWYWLGVWIRQNTPGLQPWPHRRKLNFDQVLRLLEPNGDGVFYRHPKLAPWNNPYDKKFGFSRDQMVPLVAAMGVWGKQEELRRLWDALPEDALGKHSFNGNWRNLLGQDGWDCTAIKRRSCDATRSCPLKEDTRDCSLKTDTRSCPLEQDTRSCSVCLISNPFTGGCILYGNDPICELAKATQNAIYKANKDACEAAKAAQNVIYAGEKAQCETAKAAQNVIYKQEKDACEVVKAGEKLTCEAQKSAELSLCRLNNIHSGDFIGPMTENLFARARGESLSDWKGEAELLANVLLRIHDASDRDNTGDDLNLLVMLLMAKLRTPSADSESGVALYASMRPFSYGSYLRTYRMLFGHDATEMTQRIDAGIKSGWRADLPPANGAVHWYHRVEAGGNEQLAELYDPIIDRYVYGDQTGTFSTSTSTTGSPTVSSVAPLTGLSGGGTPITIVGSGFISGATVLIDGVPATNIVVVNSTIITAITPAHADGLVNVSVTVPWPGGGTTTLPNGFGYQSTQTRVPPLPTGIAKPSTGEPDAVPLPPTFLSRAVTSAGVRLTWTGASTATGYTVKRGARSGEEVVIARHVESTTFVDASATRGQRYYYVVTAENSRGESGASHEVSVRAGRAAPGDFDGDGRADMTLYRDATGQWLRLLSGTNFTQGQATLWGIPGDVPVPGDYDGDGLDDLAIYRPSTGTWLIAYSTTRYSTWVPYLWGLPGDIPVPGDYDGDGRTDPAVYRPTTGYWLILRSSDGYRSTASMWGMPGDVPVPADYDGDGKTDLAVYRPATGYWLIVPSSGNGGWTVVRWGVNGDVAVPGDFDGDGKTDIAVFRPSTGYWLILKSSANNQSVAYRWALPGDLPVPADYDGDGTTDLAVYRPSTGHWIVLMSNTGFTQWMSAIWGASEDVPLTESR